MTDTIEASTPLEDALLDLYARLRVDILDLLRTYEDVPGNELAEAITEDLEDVLEGIYVRSHYVPLSFGEPVPEPYTAEWLAQKSLRHLRELRAQGEGE